MILIEVVYALPDVQHRVQLKLEQPCTARQALALSGLQAKVPETDLSVMDMGIYARPLDGRLTPSPDNYIMREGDRLEIYRPLQLDPKKARLQRAARNRQRN